MSFADYWYVVAESRELTRVAPLARRVLDERLVCFRAADGSPTVLRDRCLHRNAPLSGGVVQGGRLSCPYHGWTYDGEGQVVAIPSLSGERLPAHCTAPYPVIEQHGFIYVRLQRDAPADLAPFPMPHYGEAGWTNLRLQNRFANNVANCVENFIDIPHTAFVHRGIFRSTRGEQLTATVRRADGAVHVSYRNERDNLGSYRWFLNPRGDEIRHGDSFHAPNVSSVIYEIGRKTFIITSQAVPVDERETLVYTDLTYRFGLWNALAAAFVRRHAQRIIDQDVEILARQGENIARYGAEFLDAPADLIHRLVDSIREAIGRGEDPRALPLVEHEIEFRV
ncbi:aromatic ring-hydroxylating dioxygenase subunit alpha [Accumulibacter sp.]|uniref:aromatic ring-hydroxylating dioxygenase subunit alpha n=1 Tax=Accumulibacter sp. TaxID=2053492 RepID=UPI0028C39F64|nr:aromatic ring-hydroxylating dioxygenase subunit alpha [Accumulibacter sp.]